MKSVFGIAKSHIALPVSTNLALLKKILREWQLYSDHIPLQEKPTHAAALHVAVHRCSGTPGLNKNKNKKAHETPSVGSGSTDASLIATYSVPLRLWTAVLPWEVQRGLSFSELRLPHAQPVSDPSVDTNPATRTQMANDCKEEIDEADPYGVVTTPDATAAAAAAAMAVAPSPGMLFVMGPTPTAAGGLSFWSGAILRPIDVAFIAPMEPSATATPSFRQLRTSRDDKDPYFPDGELESSTVRFVVHSHAHLDPFPRVNPCEVSGTRRHHAEPIGAGGANLRYVLETTRYLMRDAIASARQHSMYDGDVEVSFTLELSDSLKNELREKARLCVNYIPPLEEQIRHYLRASNLPVAREEEPESVTATAYAHDGAITITMKEEKEGEENKKKGEQEALSAPHAFRRSLSDRSPMLYEESAGTPRGLCPSFTGKEKGAEVISAAALARLPRTHAHMPVPRPLDYELFELCVRLGLCMEDVYYHLYGRMLNEWRKELKGGEALIGEADVIRVLRLVRDASLQIPSELSDCAEALARRRGIVLSDTNST